MLNLLFTTRLTNSKAFLMSYRFCTLILAALAFLLSSCVTASDQVVSDNLTAEQVKRAKSGKMYLMSDNQMKDVDDLLAKAKSNNKLALIAMGANWCHDSISLAKKLNRADVQEVIEPNYELLFVDVGYLTHIKEVITRFDQPVIYATPTVLVIDPNTEQQINADNMHLWRSADSISIKETIEYFAEVSNNRQSRLDKVKEQKERNVGEFKSLNQQIDEFEQNQANRLYKAFKVIGPMLEKDEQGEKVKDFRKYWKSVAKFRYKVTGDLKNLREKAIELSNDSDQNASLEFPSYASFAWE